LSLYNKVNKRSNIGQFEVRKSKVIGSLQKVLSLLL